MELDPNEALQMLNEAVATLNIPRANHNNLLVAINVIQAAINKSVEPSKIPTPKQPVDKK